MPHRVLSSASSPFPLHLPSPSPTTTCTRGGTRASQAATGINPAESGACHHLLVSTGILSSPGRRGSRAHTSSPSFCFPFIRHMVWLVEAHRTHAARRARAAWHPYTHCVRAGMHNQAHVSIYMSLSQASCAARVWRRQRVCFVGSLRCTEKDRPCPVAGFSSCGPPRLHHHHLRGPRPILWPTLCVVPFPR